jgi:LacI family transcriptional regulator, gluconate utilization system Gnt-I transcriptional repressor
MDDSQDTRKYPSARPVGLKEIARRIGVSPMTVSRAINQPELVLPETRERIYDVIRSVGFVPNQVAGNLARNRSRIIGTVVPPLINAGIAEQVQGMSDLLGAEGYQLLIAQGPFTPELEERLILSLLAWQPAGFVLQAFVASERARQILLTRRIPVVEISEIEGQEPIGALVGVSNHAAARAMTLHLAAKGYRRIAFIDTPPHGNDRLQRRALGYRAAMAELRRKPIAIEGPMTVEFGAQALALLHSLRPDVVFCPSDTLAIGLLQACHRAGVKVPQDLAVAGYGDLDLAAQMYPSLTTVCVRRYEMGRLAAQTVLDMAMGGKPDVTDIGFEIIDRESA